VRFTVVGAGAIGAYVGACLARGGSEVTLVARGPHLRAMQAHGVSVQAEFTVKVDATDDLGAVADADVVIVALKAYSLPELAPRIASYLREGTATVWAQNGVPWWYFQSYPGPLGGAVLESVDPGGRIAAAVPGDSVIGCVVYSSTEIVAPGVVRHVEGTRFPIGEPDGTDTPRCRAISDAFGAAGLKAPVDPRLRDQIWLKLVGNVAFNPITALTGATLGDLGRLPEVVAVVRAIFEECAAVADRLGVRFPISLERRMQAGFAVGNHKTSMLQDLEAGKPLELDCLSGAVIELADRFGIDVPHVRTVHACAKLRSGTVV
jgi:2-dehydropantoate 2-reductase